MSFARTADTSTPLVSAVLAFILFTATACTDENENVETPQQEPTPLSYSTVWSADTGTDLFARPAELIRAVSEAAELAAFTGSDTSYPGYSDALNASRYSLNTNIDYWFVSGIGMQPHPSTYVKHMVNLQSGPRIVSATVCRYTVYPIAGENHPLEPLRRSVRIELANETADAGTPGPIDTEPSTTATEPARAPSWDVFEGWTITEIKSLDDEDIPEACVDWWQQRFPEFTRKPGGNILFPPPGYEYPTAPVAAQYPEWIPPNDHN